MKRIKYLFLVFLVLYVFLIPTLFLQAYAVDVIPVVSPLVKPVPSIVVNQDGSKTYTLYAVDQYAGDSLLREAIFTIPSTGSVLFWRRNPNTCFIWSDTVVSVTRNNYDLLTGFFTGSDTVNFTSQGGPNPPDDTHLYYFSFRAGYWPSQSVYNSALSAWYTYFPEELPIKISYNPTAYNDDWITWASVIPDPVTYRSYTSEPVADDYNRYFVFAGPDHQYLYHVHYYVPSIWVYDDNFSVESSGGIQTEHRVSVFDLLYPKVNNTDNGLSIDLSVDPDLLAFWNLSGNTEFAYNIQISKFDLLTGQFLSTEVYQDVGFTTSVTFNYDLGLPEDYDSCYFWGVFYNDTSTSYHFNRLSCFWSTDPSFLTWQSDILSYLDLIYHALVDNDQPDITVGQDTSAFDAMQSAADDLRITDASGNPVNAADQVSVALSDAAVGLSSAQLGLSGVNSLITSLFSVNPIVVVPLIVALALGLVVTILGKDKSD